MNKADTTSHTDVLAFTDGLGIDGETAPHATAAFARAVDVSDAGHGALPTSRSVLVTGGGRGIGAAIAQRYVAAGHRVASLSRSGDSPCDSITAFRCDVADADSVASAMQAAVKMNGPIDILVANAGITDDKLMLRMDEASFTNIIDINLIGAYRLVKAVSGPMLRNRWGRLVFISSVVAMSGSAGQANYAASKAGLIGFARSLAREFGPRGVTSNVVSPGFVETDMTAVLGDDRREEVLKSIPLNRTGTCADVAATVDFLTSEAAGYITGAVIPVDGGLGMGN